MAIQRDFDRFFLNHLQIVNAESGRYCNHRFLGRGGNGTAFLVTCVEGPNEGMQFALKVFHKVSDARRREAFLGEIRHLRACDHPAIVRVYDEGTFTTQHHTYPLAVMEYIPLTARHLLVRREIGLLRAIRIALNCLSALRCIHTATSPLVHRDIKPENILINEVAAKLADFGLVKVLEDVEQEERPEDALEGTQWPGMPFRYRTPELVRRANGEDIELTTASDIYQFGTVFYELITSFNPQKKPNRILDPIEIDMRDIGGALGPDLTRLVRDMLQDDPAVRPTAAECLQRLGRIHLDLCDQLGNVTGSQH